MAILIGLGGAAPARPPRSKPRPKPAPVAAAPVAAPLAGPENRYNYVAQDQQRFRSATSPGYAYLPSAAPTDTAQYQLRPGAVVFSWHPYWLNNAYVNYDFRLLSHVAYFGYQADEAGGLVVPPNQSPAGLVAAARARNKACRVLLTVAYREPDQGATLFRPGGEAAQRRLMDAIVEEVAATETDGVNLDVDLWQPADRATVLSQLQLQLRQRKAQLDAKQDQLQAYEQAHGLQVALAKAQQGEAAANTETLALYQHLLTQGQAYLAAQQATLAQEQAALDKASQQLAARRQALGYPGQFWGFVKRWVYHRRDLAAYSQDSVALAQRQQAHATRLGLYQQRRTTYQADSAAFTARKLARQELAVTDTVTSKNYQAQKLKFKRELAQFNQESATLQRAAKQGLLLPGAAGLPSLSPQGVLLRDFIAGLAVRLRARNPTYQLALSVPPVDVNHAYAGLQAVEPLVALFIVKAFDYTPYNLIVPGPLAPLHPSDEWGQHSISTSVAYYLGQGLAPQHLIVGLPHMAKLWQIDSLDGRETPQLRGFITNQQLHRHLPQPAGPLDKPSLSLYYSFPPLLGQVGDQAWGEDSLSLAPKYTWLTKQQLAGVGIWAPGYDDGSATNWHLLRAHFAGPVAQTAPATAATDDAGAFGILYRHRHVLLLAVAILVGGFLFGLLIASLLQANVIVPVPTLAGSVGLLIGLCLLIEVGYVFYTGYLSAQPEQLLWTIGAAVLLALVFMALMYRQYWRRQWLP